MSVGRLQRWLPVVPRLQLTSTALLLAALVSPALGQTGTFLDRDRPTDLRVASYNVEFDTIFADTSATQAPKIARLLQAIQPDVLNLQEIYDHSAADVATLMDSILPLAGGGHWYAHKSYDTITASKYPLTMLGTDTIPEPNATSVALSLVNLPDDTYPADFYFMNNHFKCCGDVGSSEDQQRQRQADALVNWMRDARTPGGNVNLPANTPMAVVGDLNIVGGLQPLNTLITGNIINEGTYGSDSPPDWDGTPLADLHPLHNVTGPDDYTWRDDGSQYDPGRLDFILYTDGVIGTAKSFVLNTTTMSAAALAATGLLRTDAENSPGYFDHLPLVADFRFPAPALPGDYNSDGRVDAADYDAWRTAFGTSNTAVDGNRDGVVDGADYTLWRDNFGSGAAGVGAVAAVPEPAGAVAVVTACVSALSVLRRRRGELAAVACQAGRGIAVHPRATSCHTSPQAALAASVVIMPTR